MTVLPAEIANRIAARLTRLYGERAAETLAAVESLCASHVAACPAAQPKKWDQRDIALITYGDMVQSEGEPALATLRRFLHHRALDDLFSTVHLLPFFPYTSDDGFSVVDYRRVDPPLGDWSHVQAIGKRVDLMFDLVLNHVSRSSVYFQKYAAGEAPFDRFFIEVDPATDLSKVTRPRPHPLLTEVQTSRGPRHVWTTFSDDQMDLNFAEPAVLLEMLDVLLSFVRRGARIVRLDAIAYLWKEIGTNCIHLPQTHEVVKLLRDVVSAVAPHVLLLTETNVPHAENVSYFGDGDEAHMVYNFSLPPLLLDAFLQRDVGPLTRWLKGLSEPPPGCAYFNFAASHDGVGVRPLEGLVSHERFDALVAACQQRGGRVGLKTNPDGSKSPYELNITYFDALGPAPGDRFPPGDEAHVRRFLASQAIVLALKGVPGIYFHSLVGTPNDTRAVEETGINRRINRRKYGFDELTAILRAAGSPQHAVFEGFRHLLAVRRDQPAFHPDAKQTVIDTGDGAVFGFFREFTVASNEEAGQRILVLANTADQPKQIVPHLPPGGKLTRDLLSSTATVEPHTVQLRPHQAAWLELGT